MYIKPQEYLLQLKKRIAELETELAEIKPIYNSLSETVEIEPINNPSQNLVEDNGQLTSAEKIARAQRKRHRRERDKKTPFIVSYLQEAGSASIKKISEKVSITTDATKTILRENPDKFYQNTHNRLWELKQN